MPKMDRDIVVKTVTENYDRRIENLRNELVKMKDPDQYAVKLESWRDVCREAVSTLHERIERGVATDGEMERFKLPEMPGKPREYELDRKERELQNAVNAKESALRYLAARKVDEDGALTITQAELSHVGFNLL